MKGEGMTRYLVTYETAGGAVSQLAHTEGDVQSEVAAWTRWAAEAGESVVDLGAPLGAARIVGAGGSVDLGPRISGYSLVDAADLDGAVALISGHPHLRLGSINVFETISLQGN